MSNRKFLVLSVLVAALALAASIVLLPRVGLSQVSGCSGVSFVPSCRPTFATVATLPACNAASQGVMYMVNDATAPTALATVAGAGAVHVGVTCNGANWIVQ